MRRGGIIGLIGRRGELRDLKATIGKNPKRNLERACEGVGLLTVLTRSQGRTDISREEFRDTLRWRLDIPL